MITQRDAASPRDHNNLNLFLRLPESNAARATCICPEAGAPRCSRSPGPASSTSHLSGSCESVGERESGVGSPTPAVSPLEPGSRLPPPPSACHIQLPQRGGHVHSAPNPTPLLLLQMWQLAEAAVPSRPRATARQHRRSAFHAPLTRPAPGERIHAQGTLGCPGNWRKRCPAETHPTRSCSCSGVRPSLPVPFLQGCRCPHASRFQAQLRDGASLPETLSQLAALSPGNNSGLWRWLPRLVVLLLRRLLLLFLSCCLLLQSRVGKAAGVGTQRRLQEKGDVVWSPRGLAMLLGTVDPGKEGRGRESASSSLAGRQWAVWGAGLLRKQQQQRVSVAEVSPSN